ncbi:uncharacterized protein PV06_11449 [Exophiala oligosperma]|uniref:Uncharacterized protein n=1 Tax=Exophiala oligosperma TaxID=215243 RepID=A0A0D2A7F0_9EURO|nr:uncharacterized protein PV06_11449 [Exophiala oligosperma]KIW36261.1 hypothetical protein PV06_11449 [Exophiala oligosperma]
MPPARDGQTLPDGVHELDLAAPTISSGNHAAVDGRVIPPGRVDKGKSGRSAQEMEAEHGSSQSNDPFCESHRSIAAQP